MMSTGQNLILLADFQYYFALSSLFFSYKKEVERTSLLYILFLFDLCIFLLSSDLLTSRLGLHLYDLTFLFWGVLPGGQALPPPPGPSSPAHSSASTQDSFGIQVISEPWQNWSLEGQMQARIGVLENANSIFLLDKERGQYWAEVKQMLEQAPSQQEYTILLEFENWDLQIREKNGNIFPGARKTISSTSLDGKFALCNSRDCHSGVL